MMKNQLSGLEAERSRLHDKALECRVPEHTIDGLIRYVVNGIEPGGFLLSFLENDLMGALGKADQTNVLAFWEIGNFVHNCIPMDCHGSPEKVEKWRSGWPHILRPWKKTDTNAILVT